MRRRAARVALAGLAVAGLTLSTGVQCATEDEIEQWRRASEGGLTTPAAQAAAQALIDALEQDLGGPAGESLAARMVFHQTPGVSVAVVNAGVVEWTEAWGTSNSVAGTPLRHATRLQAGSVSKPTTALALLKLVQQGVVQLDAPLNDALVSWKIPDNAFTAAQPVTLRQVLSHTAGMNNSGFFGYDPAGAIPTLLQVLTGAPPATTPPMAVVQTPGSDWMYSGGAYTILAQVVEDQTGQSFTDWMQQNVLYPAGMLRSTFEQPLQDPDATSFGVASLFGFPAGAVAYPEQPAAGLWSTSLDLGRLVVAIQESLAGTPGAILDASTAAGMITPQVPSPTFFDVGLSPSPRMGLGLFLADGPSPDWFFHVGSNTGFQCVIVGDTRGLGLGVAVMTNSFPGGRPLAWEVVNRVADLYAWPSWGDWGI